MTTDMITLRSDDLELTVAARGAEMQSLKAGGTELLWHGDPAFWGGRAPLLFPIVGPAPEGTITVGDFESEMGNHGFARRAQFALLESGPDYCVQELTDSDETRAQFPFGFSLKATHRLEGKTLSAEIEITNTGETVMPYSFGFHPAFLWPLPGCEDKPHSVTLDNGGEPALARLTGTRLGKARFDSPFTKGALTLDPSQFTDDAMIFPEGAGEGLTFGAEGGPQLRFTFENLQNLAIWSKPTGAPFLCVEPWQGMHAAEGGTAELSERPYSTSLAPGASAHYAYRLTVAL